MARYLPLALALALAAPAIGRTQTAADQRQEVLAFVRAYVDAANRADWSSVADAYAKRPDVIRVKSGAVTRGWEAIRNEVTRARRSASADRVSVGVVEVMSLSATVALAVVPIEVTVRTQQGVEQIRGTMSLLVEKTPDGWRIIHDHTSSGEPGR
jgi:uncharacterized protein (TIGR02246 family)